MSWWPGLASALQSHIVPAKARSPSPEAVWDLCSETYQYYNLPFCEPESKQYKFEGLGGVLAGDRTVNSLYSVNFGEDSANTTLCTRSLNAKEVEQFRKAVASEYYFQVSSAHTPPAPGVALALMGWRPPPGVP